MRNGIDFRRADCYFSVEKKRLIQNKGLNAYAILNLLLDKIFYEDGYYLKWDSNAIDDFSYDLKLKSSIVKDVVEYALHLGIFDKDKYNKFGVLTSEEIQKNYKIATYKRVNQWHNKKLCYTSVLQTLKTDDGNSKTDDGNNKKDIELEREKSKVKEESKVKSKVEEKELNKKDEIAPSIFSHLDELSKKLNKELTSQGFDKIDFNNIDLDLLEKKVNESDFLKNCPNLNMNWLLLNYKKIINDNYLNFKKTPETSGVNKALITHQYTKEELDTAFSDLDQLW